MKTVLYSDASNRGGMILHPSLFLKKISQTT